MRLLMIRHGESEADILNVHEGRADFNLTEKGHSQAKALAEYLKTRCQIQKIYASPLKRASQTAQYIADAYGLDILKDEHLMEFNNGLIAGLSFEEADEKYPYMPNLPLHEAVYEQESALEFRHRAEYALSRILSENAEAEADAVIAVVSHGGMINQLYQAFLRLPVDSGCVFGTGDTGVHEWVIKNGKRYVAAANQQKHLQKMLG